MKNATPMVHPGEPGGESMKLLIMRVGPFALGMPLDGVSRILAPPDDGSDFAATVFFEKDALPVVSLSEVLGLGNATPPRRVVVVSGSSEFLAYGIDAALLTITVDRARIEAVPPDASLLPHGALAGAVVEDGRTVFVLDPLRFEGVLR